MTMEDYQIQQVLCIAQMAATLEAGDRANSVYRPTNPTPEYYAARATELFDAANALLGETEREK